MALPGARMGATADEGKPHTIAMSAAGPRMGGTVTLPGVPQAVETIRWQELRATEAVGLVTETPALFGACLAAEEARAEGPRKTVLRALLAQEFERTPKPRHEVVLHLQTLLGEQLPNEATG